MSIKYPQIRVFTCNAKQILTYHSYKTVEKTFSQLHVISICNELSQPLDRVVGLLIKSKLYEHYCFKGGGGTLKKNPPLMFDPGRWRASPALYRLNKNDVKFIILKNW